MTGVTIAVGQVVFPGRPMTCLTFALIARQFVFTGRPKTGLTIILGQVVFTGQPMTGLIINIITGQVVFTLQILTGLTIRIISGQVVFTGQIFYMYDHWNNCWIGRLHMPYFDWSGLLSGQVFLKT